MKKFTPRTRRVSPYMRGTPRGWRESFTLWIDFMGERWSIGPLLDHIVGSFSDGGGSMVVGPPVSDQSWTFYAREAAVTAFERLKAACKHRWSNYVEIRLLHDDKPDRCPPPESVIRKNKGKTIVLFKNPKPGSGPLVIRKFKSGKLPKGESIPRFKKRKRRVA